MIAAAPDGAVIFERKQVKPSLHEQRAHAAVPVQDGAVAPRGAARQAQRLVRQSPAVMHRSQRQADTYRAAIALDHADAAGDVVQPPVAAAEDQGRDDRTVVSVADPAGDHHGCRQGHFQAAESIVRAPVIVVQEGSPALVPHGSARIQLGYTTLTAPISSLTGILQVDDGNPLPAAEATTIVVIAQGKPLVDAIRDACLLGFHPILMTTAAAPLGALPLMLATGNGAELRPPLG